LARAFLGLGSNLGDREANIRESIERLSHHPIRIEKVSSIYETAPVGLTDQPDFLNAVAEIETDLDPFELLDVVMNVEKELGRVRNIRWGPRVIDIDVLLICSPRPRMGRGVGGEGLDCDAVVIDTPELVVPHPRMTERAFVMAPLAEIEPDLKLPDGRTPVEILDGLRDQQAKRM